MFQLWLDIPMSWHNTLLETLSTTSKACMHKTCKSWYEWTNVESGFKHPLQLTTNFAKLDKTKCLTNRHHNCFPLPMKKTSAMIMGCLGSGTMKSHLYT